jgi:hypothetical protein
MAIPTFTAPPPAPQRTDAPDTFIAKADAFVAWFSPFEAELEAAVTWFNATASQVAISAGQVSGSAALVAAASSAVLAVTDYIGTSFNNLGLTAGAKTLHLNETGRKFAVSDSVMLVSRFDPEKRMAGVITAWDGINMTLTVPEGGFVGSGWAADWMVVLEVFAAVAGSGADVLRASSSLMSISPRAVRESYAPVFLPFAATITPNNHNALDFKMDMTGNCTLAPIINTYPGARGSIEIVIQGAGGWVMTFNPIWKRVGGPAVLSTTPLAVDELQYVVKSVDGLGGANRIIYGHLRNPT